MASFGLSLEAALDAVKKKTDKATNVARERVLNRWLGREQRYRTPSGPTASTPRNPAVTDGKVDEDG